MLKNGCREVDNQWSCFRERRSRATYHYFYHHAAISTCEITTAQRVHELRGDRPVGGLGSERLKVKGGEYIRHEEKGHTHRAKAIENGSGGKQNHTV
jgi:hypothetical protein